MSVLMPSVHRLRKLGLLKKDKYIFDTHPRGLKSNGSHNRVEYHGELLNGVPFGRGNLIVGKSVITEEIAGMWYNNKEEGICKLILLLCDIFSL